MILLQKCLKWLRDDNLILYVLSRRLTADKRKGDPMRDMHLLKKLHNNKQYEGHLRWKSLGDDVSQRLFDGLKEGDD